jgi:hypothetical protein
LCDVLSEDVKDEFLDVVEDTAAFFDGCED